MQEIKLLKGIWCWKVLSYPLAKRLYFPTVSPGNFYNKVRRLIGEGLLSDTVGDGLIFDVLQLTKLGFSLIRHDLGDLKEQRFNPQSVAHDYWATAFQLGIFLNQSGVSVFHASEQEVQSFDTDLLPSWLPKSRDHIPDGFFEIKDGETAGRFAIEVDLNLKSFLKYDKTAYHFDGIDCEIDVVFWLCGNIAIAEAIFSRLQDIKLRRLEIHHFFVTDDFKFQGWNAKARAGEFVGKSIQEICLWKTYGKPLEKLCKPYGKEEMEILFPTLKTAFKKRG